ncbi:hypothetical protein V6N13_085041 [Hibiscus sabdariffa]|uniref:Uncharacterized protein n=1 Tax=Hibiscus sabdariffa TaxID=183260 RepID=A0ABR2D0B2_9ROSI
MLRLYDWVVQLSLSSVSALFFVCLTGFVKKYGLRRFLFFDKLCDESETVRKCHTAQLNSSMFHGVMLMALLHHGFRPRLHPFPTHLQPQGVLYNSSHDSAYYCGVQQRLHTKWHVCATLDSFEANDGETTRTPTIRGWQALPHVGTDGESDGDNAGNDEDDFDNKKLIPAYAYRDNL